MKLTVLKHKNGDPAGVCVEPDNLKELKLLESLSGIAAEFWASKNSMSMSLTVVTDEWTRFDPADLAGSR